MPEVRSLLLENPVFGTDANALSRLFLELYSFCYYELLVKRTSAEREEQSDFEGADVSIDAPYALQVLEEFVRL